MKVTDLHHFFFCKIGNKGPHNHRLFGKEPSNFYFYFLVVETEAQSGDARDGPGQWPSTLLHLDALGYEIK